MNISCTCTRLYSKQQGLALLPIVIIITVVAAVSLLMSYESSMNVNETAAQQEAKQADLVAEAGMAHAKWQLMQNTTCTGYTNISTTSFGAHNYTVNITPNSGSPVIINASGVSNSGITRSLTDSGMKVYQTAFTNEFVLDATGKDSFIEGENGHTDHNKGSDQYIKIKSQTNKEKRGLLHFDITEIPTNSKIIDATLELYLDKRDGPDSEISIHRVTDDWVENEVTWIIKRSGFFQNWSPPGGEYTATISGSFTADAVGWESAKITQLVQDWVKVPSINNGMILLSTPTSLNNEKTFISSDNIDTTRHPKLTVTFACECGQSCLFSGMEPIVLSTDSAAVLGGLAFDDIDLAEYDPSTDTASLYFDGSLADIESDIDALHIMDNGHLLLSMKDEDELGDEKYQDGDLVDYDPVTDIATLFFDENKFSADEDIVSVFLMNNGHILMTTDSAATLGGLSFSDEDIVEYDPVNDSATLYFDGSTTTLNSDIDALHVLSNGNIVLSTKDDATLGGLSFNDGDLVIYDPNTDIAAIYMEEGLFSANEDVISAHIGTGSGVGVSDDAEQLISDGTMYVYSTDLELADNLAATSQPTDIVGIRFNYVAIPQGETITNAYIQFQVDELDSGVASLTIEAEAVDNAETFTTTPFNITSRVRTLASVLWSPPVWDTVGERGPDQRTIDLSPVIQEIVDRTGWSSGNSIAFIISGTGVRTAESSEGDPAGAPELVIEFGSGSWSSGGGDGGGGGGGSDGGPTNILLVVGNASSLSQADTDRWKMITDWGYTVTVFDDGESQSEFDKAVAANDVIFVTNSVIGGTLSNKLTEANKGVVNEFPGKLDNFGFSSGTTQTYYSTGFSNSDASHDITSPYKGAPISTFSSLISMSVPSGSLASGLQNLGSPNGAPGDLDVPPPGLSILDMGATRLDGSPAPARRMHLPFGNATVTQMTADGLELMERSIEWAGSGGGGDCKGTYRDEFNTISYSGNEGTLTWSTDWLEFNESNGPSSGDEQVRSDLGRDYMLRVRDNDGGGEGVEREADLSAYEKATLRFYYRRNSLDNSSDYVKIEVSSNGGGSWNEIYRIEGPGTDSSYESYDKDIDSYISPTTRIRFVTSSTMGGTDEVYFDDVEIAASGCVN